MNKLTCPNCGAGIPARSVNIQSMMAVCEQCDTVFQFDAAALEKAKREKLKAPRDFTVRQDDERLEISYHYRQHLGTMETGLLIICGIGTVLGAGALGLTFGNPIPMLIFGAITAFCIYFITAYMLDTANIVLDDDALKFYEKPVFGFSDHTYPRDEVVRIVCKPADANQINSHDAYFNILCVMRDGTERPFMRYVRRDLAFYIQRMLNAAMQGDADEGAATPARLTDQADTPELSLDSLMIGEDGELIERPGRGDG